jgi:glycosyltransferase involved in cell wall biosynthesis
MRGESGSTPPPMVSIVIPTRDRAGLLTATIESARAQTLGEWEVVVVDDQSKDETCARVEAMASEDRRIRLIRRTAPPGGAPACRNLGLAAARGRYVIFFDSDDLLAADALEHRVRFMEERAELDFGVFDGMVFRQVAGDERALLNCDTHEDDLDRFLRFDIPWGTPGPIWRREALERIGPWDEKLVVGQDLDFSMRALASGLRYERGRRVDHFIRGQANRGQTVGADPWEPRKLPSHLHRLKRISQLLRRSGEAWTRERRDLLAGNFFWIAQQWREQGYRRESMEAWDAARAQGLVNYGRYVQGKIFLAALPYWFAPLLMLALCRVWPREMFICNRRTFFSATEAQQRAAEIPFSQLHPDARYREALADGWAMFVLRRISPRRVAVAVSRRVRA